MTIPPRTAAIAALVLTLAATAHGQVPDPNAPAQAQPLPQPEPEVAGLPDAWVSAPPWLLKEIPFDLQKFLRPPTAARNAAPLYWEALFEFSPSVAGAFPNTAARVERSALARQRMERAKVVIDGLRATPNAALDKELEQVVVDHQLGFQKLVEAQKRPQCAFLTGFDVDSSAPHLEAATEVVAVGALRVRFLLRRNDVANAARTAEVVTRFIQDIRPRGTLTAQLTAHTLIQITCLELIQPVLAAPGLRVEHADRLVKALQAYDDEKSYPAYDEGVKSIYIQVRTLLHAMSLPRDQDPADALNRAKVLAIEVLKVPSAPGRDAGREIEARLKREAGTEPSVVGGLTRQVRALLELRWNSYANYIKFRPAALRFLTTRSLLATVATTLERQVDSFVLSLCHAQATVRATACLAAFRRWGLARATVADDLFLAVRAAGMAAVPQDPFSARPFRWRAISGQPVVFSIGVDGKDDSGLLDSANDTRPGDLLFRLPPPILPVSAQRKATLARP